MHQADDAGRLQHAVRVTPARSRRLRRESTSPELALEGVADLQRRPTLGEPRTAPAHECTRRLLDACEVAVAAQRPVTDMHGEPPPGLPAIQRRGLEKADDLGVAIHRSERLEVLGAE